MNILKSILFINKNESISFWATFIGSILIILLGVKMFWGLSGVMDVLLWDESFYLKHGVNLQKKIPINWGPFYSFWYYLLHFFENDKVSLYYLNFKLMSILPIVAAFWFFLLRGINYYVAFLICIMWMASGINITVWPKVTQYTNLVVILGLIIALNYRGQFMKYFVLTFIALCVSYARPELFLSFLAFSGITIIVFFLEKPKLEINQKIFVVFLFVFSGILIYFLGISLFRDPRSGVAFGQHFMLNYYNWNQIDLPFWLSGDKEINAIFNHPKSLGDFYKGNTELFNKHIFSNIKNYFNQLNTGLSDVFFPKLIFHLPSYLRWLALLSSIVVFIVVSKSTKGINFLGKGLLRNGSILFVLLLFCFPSFISSILIYPREHYFILQLPLFIFFIGTFFYQSSEKKGKMGYKISIVFLIFFIGTFVSPKAKDFAYFDLWRKEKSLCNQKVIAYLKERNFKGQIEILENEGGLNSFLPKNFKWVQGYTKDESWNNYLAIKNINVIYITPSLLTDTRFVEDKEWLKFIEQPSKYGFTKIKIGNFTPYLLIKKDLLINGQ